MENRRYLYHARINSHLSLQQIGARTALSPSVLRHIDEGRFEQLPSGLYARSYVRAFAGAVGVNPEEALAAVEAFLPGAPDPLALMNEAKGSSPVERFKRQLTNLPSRLPSFPPLLKALSASVDRVKAEAVIKTWSASLNLAAREAVERATASRVEQRLEPVLNRAEPSHETVSSGVESRHDAVLNRVEPWHETVLNCVEPWHEGALNRVEPWRGAVLNRVDPWREAMLNRVQPWREAAVNGVASWKATVRRKPDGAPSPRWTRCGAVVIDALLLFVVDAFLVLLISWSSGVSVTLLMRDAGWAVGSFCAIPVALYFLLFGGIAGSTLGGYVCSLMTPAQRHPLTLPDILRRAVKR